MSLTLNFSCDRFNNRIGVSTTVAPTDPVVIDASVEVANGQTDKVLSIGGIDVSQLAAIWIDSNQAITLETNDATSPDDTIVLAANVPYIWQTGNPAPLLLTEDVASAIYCTNASGAAATIRLRAVQDGTP
jgi:hypothetical protein